MNRKYESALKKAGMDTNQYFSLRIDKNEIPDGAEVVVQVRDRITGELRPLPMNEALDKCFAKNSRFYKQVMADGHIFNPYIHRRFLPAQFKRNIRVAGYNGIERFVQTHYGWNYITRFLREECAKLAMLERRDKEAFRERRRFFSLEDMQAIFRAYVDTVHKVLDEAAKCPHTYHTAAYEYSCNPHLHHEIRKAETYCVIMGIGGMKLTHIRPMKYRFQMFADAVSACRGYAQLSDVLSRFDFCTLDNALLGDAHFAKCFLASGAFYTLKHMIMFEGLQLNGANVADSLKTLEQYPVGTYMNLYRSLNL